MPSLCPQEDLRSDSVQTPPITVEVRRPPNHAGLVTANSPLICISGGGGTKAKLLVPSTQLNASQP